MPLTPPTRPADSPPHAAAMVWAHWATAGCVLLAFGAVLLRECVDGDALRALLLLVHRQAGLTALAATLLRLVLRPFLHRAGTPDASARWARRAAGAAHVAIYLGLLVVPLLGWWLSDARGQHPAAWGLLPLPTLAPTDPDAADLAEDRHGLAAWTLAALAGLHIAAALWHHWVLRDGVLRAMAPRRGGRPRSTTPQTPTTLPQERSAR